MRTNFKLFLILVFSILVYNAKAQVVINEIMYNPPETGTDSLEFIELYNAGTSAVDLTGYQFTSGITFTFPTISIASENFLLLAVNSTAFDNTFGVSSIQWTSGSLNNGGEALVLVDAQGALVDSVQYDDATPWVTSPDGNGPSLELIDPALDNALAQNWDSCSTTTTVFIGGIEVFATPGAVNSVTTPTIQFVTGSALVDEAIGTVSIDIHLANAGGTSASVEVVLGSGTATNGSDFNFTSPTIVSFTAGGNATQTITLPIVDDAIVESAETVILNLQNANNATLGALDQFTVTITDNDGSQTVETLYINEFLASNTADTTDEYGENDDWIEIYNPNNYAVDLAGYFITDDATVPTKYQIPSGTNTVISANGFKLIWADNNDSQGALHTNFGLSASGEFVGLYGFDTTVVDSLSFGAQTADESYGRNVDGGSVWVVFLTTTPGASNNVTAIEEHLSSELKVYPNPVSGGEVYFNKVVNVGVYNQLGKLVLSERNTKSITIEELSRGAYFIQTTDGETIKLMVK